VGSPLGSGRSSEPALLVLVSLLDGAKHGYAIGEDITAVTGRRLGPGTLYAALDRLERDGLVASQPRQGRRRPYTLTPRGEAEARHQVQTLGRLVEEGRRRLAARPAPGPA
jgi:DNA-binding PadR family transcriptional regulator